jgi:hypothetical protein
MDTTNRKAKRGESAEPIAGGPSRRVKPQDPQRSAAADQAGREAQLERQIERVKRDLAALGDLRPGSLSTQYNVCGTPGCRCKADPPQKHGPYYQVSFSRKGKSSTKFVKKEDLPAIRKQLKNYERMKALVDLWIDLATELSNLRLTQNRT